MRTSPIAARRPNKLGWTTFPSILWSRRRPRSSNPAFSQAEQLVADGFTTPAGIAFEPNGRLLLTDYATGELWRLTIPGAAAPKVASAPPPQATPSQPPPASIPTPDASRSASRRE